MYNSHAIERETLDHKGVHDLPLRLDHAHEEWRAQRLVFQTLKRLIIDQIVVSLQTVGHKGP